MRSVTVSTLHSLPPRELPWESEVSIALTDGVWLDVREDAGWWYASLRIKEKTEAVGSTWDGVNGFCDVWNGPHSSREAAMGNGYAHGRHQAIAAHVPKAKTLNCSVWSYL